jgi:hypothetical protein
MTFLRARQVAGNCRTVDGRLGAMARLQSACQHVRVRPPGFGASLHTWTWTAIEADKKLIVSWLVGGRDGDYAMAFMDDLRDRLANRVQLTSDGHRAYLEAVEGAFGADVDYAQLVKLYDSSPESMKGRYSPAERIGARKERIEGEPGTLRT